MSKERLDLIKRRIRQPVANFLIEDFEWLLQQVELGIIQQEQFHDMQTKILKLEEQIKRHKKEKYKFMKDKERYKQALEFYANGRTYELSVKISMGSAFPRHEPIKYDKGEKARKALEDDTP